MKKTAYDYIVVGAGSAGCAAAYRLAERSGADILLIEAGGSDNNPLIKMPIGFSTLIGEGKNNWNYESLPEAALDGRQIPVPRGKVLGGCSSINGMVYIRGQRQDYDGWAELGNVGWSYDEVLPFFKRSENYWGGENKYHGSTGPLDVTPVTKKLPIGDAFIDAAEQSGICRNSDFNGASQEGVGYFDANIANGIRHSSSRAFLSRRNKPKNLTVLTRFDVSRILFEGKRACAIEGVYKGRAIKLAVREEIILSAGAYNSPKLLELSGVGDTARLQKFGIDVVSHLPGVGENLQDHCNNYLFYTTKNCESYYDYIQPLRAPLTGLQYLLGRKGIFANPAAQIGAFFKLDETAVRPDTQIHFAAAAARPDVNGRLVPVPGICISICQLRPRSVGNTHIVSDRYTTAPGIQFNFLSDEKDQQHQLLAIRKLREICSQSDIANLLGPELPPLAGLGSDADLLAGIQQSLEPVHHPVGTCRMGVDDGAVVQPDLKVKGVEGLRVADASVMPRIVSGNTHAPCVMIGEKLADLVLSQ